MCAFVLAVFLVSGVSKYTEAFPVESVELNHCYDEHSKHTFSQVIVWEWCPTLKTRVVRQWWAVDKEVVSVSRDRGYYHVTFTNRLRVTPVALRTKNFRETHTPRQHDPEMLNRRVMNEHDRIPVCN
jgi:hypothetical protein